MISLRQVVRADLDTLFSLDVAPALRAFVAPNAVTLAEVSYITGGYAFSIRDGERIVGLLTLIDFREHEELLDDDDPAAAFMLRLMIGAAHQHQGYGRATVECAIDWARARNNTRFQTSFAPANAAARRLYESIGLRETGRIVEDEVEMSLDLG